MINGMVIKSPEKIFNSTSALVMILNAAGEIAWVNDACEQCLGYCLADLKKTVHQPVLSASNQEIFISMIKQAIQGNKSDPLDIPVTCSDKTEKTIRWNTMLVCHDDKPLEKYVVIFGEALAGVKQKQVDLKTLEARYCLIFENTGSGMMYISEDMTIALVNREFEKFIGYSKASIEGKMSWTELIADGDDLLRMIGYHWARRVDPASAPTSYDTKIRIKNGEVRDVILRVMMIPDTTYSLISLIDITDRKQAEKALRDNEAIFSQFMEHSPMYVFFKDENMRTIRVSKTFATLLGKPMEEIIGKTADEMFPPEIAQKMIAEYIAILKEDRAISSEAEINGRFYTTIKFPIHVEGKPRYLAGYSIDITERKKAEDKLKIEHIRLKKALDEVKTLRGIIPICSYCKQIRDDDGAWNELEKYISEHSDAIFSHGICDNCYMKHSPDFTK
jgi:PAS domain S-box-containing protein